MSIVHSGEVQVSAGKQVSASMHGCDGLAATPYQWLTAIERAIEREPTYVVVEKVGEAAKETNPRDS